jgi:hypothetical protein
VQAATIDAGVFTTGHGDATNPIQIPVTLINGGSNPLPYLDTISFDLGSFTHFNMTSTASNISFFGATIFSNNGDVQVPGTDYSNTFTAVLLPDLSLIRDYHLHPQGLIAPGGGSYTLTLWGSVAPVPVPGAVYLFGAGVVGLVGLARRKRKAEV